MTATVTRCHLPPVRMAQINNMRQQAGEDAETRGPRALPGGMRAGAAALANRAEFCPQPEGELACDPATRYRAARRHTTRIQEDVKPPCVPQPRHGSTRVSTAKSRRATHTTETRPSARGSARHLPLRAWTERRHAKRSQSVPERQTPSDLTRIRSLTHRNTHVRRRARPTEEQTLATENVPAVPTGGGVRWGRREPW